MNKFLEILKRWFDSITIDEKTKEISIFYNGKKEDQNPGTASQGQVGFCRRRQ